MKQFQVSDLLKFRLLRDLHISPQGDEVAYEVKLIDEESDTYRSFISIVSCTRDEELRFTQSEGLNGMPRWSPDGSQLAFLSDRHGDKLQLHVMPRSGGEARRLTNFDHAVSSFSWAPHGRELVVTALVDTDSPPEGESKDSERWRNRPRWINRARYKSDASGFMLHGHAHMFVVSVDGGTPKAITEGEYDVSGPIWSPDGQQLAYCRTRDGLREGHITDLWMCDRDGSEARAVSRDVASATSPTWSPNGRWIAFQGAYGAR